MATYYTGKGGSDVSDGTSWANRKLTIQAGENLCTSAGDVLYVGPGEYDESVTFSNTGSSGSEITYIGDYSGANTDGAGGPVVLANTAFMDGAYQVLRGFKSIDSDSTGAIIIKADNVTVEQCHITNYGAAGAGIFIGNGATAYSNTTIRRCYIVPGFGIGIKAQASADYASNTGNVIENCVIIGAAGNGGTGIMIFNTAGWTIRNCTIIGTGDYGVRAFSLPTSELITVNNCIISGCRWGLIASVSGELVEDYNAISNCSAARSNVSTGSNSTTDTPYLDSRWFFEALNGGTLITPFDLDANSGLVELNSGTGAPSADLRGATVQGTYREWGALEYDSTLDIEAGAGGASVYRRVARLLGG